MGRCGRGAGAANALACVGIGIFCAHVAERAYGIAIAGGGGGLENGPGVVEAIQALRGVQDTVALTVIAELGDLTRFDNPRQLAAFVGLTPSEYSSGAMRRQGGITKAGNSHA